MCTLVEGAEDDGLGVRPLHGDESSVFGLVEEFGIGSRGLVTQKGLQPFLQGATTVGVFEALGTMRNSSSPIR